MLAVDLAALRQPGAVAAASMAAEAAGLVARHGLMLVHDWVGVPVAEDLLPEARADRQLHSTRTGDIWRYQAIREFIAPADWQMVRLPDRLFWLFRSYGRSTGCCVGGGVSAVGSIVSHVASLDIGAAFDTLKSQMLPKIVNGSE